MPQRRLTWRQAAGWRLRRQHLERRAPAGALLDVASRLCGLHAQVLSSAELAAWARLEGGDRTALRRALWDERTLVKTWAMRGTLHLLPSRELGEWHAALATSPRYLREQSWKTYYGITLAELDRFTDAVSASLEGRVLTREELMREAGRRSGLRSFAREAIASSWGMLLKPAAFRGQLCFAPSTGARVRFTRPDTWLRQAPPPVPSASAAAAITRRFLSAYGPATARDLGRWWGGGMATARAWLRALGGELEEVDVEGTRAHLLSAHLPEALEPPPRRSVRLLPAFDPYVVAASPHAESLMPGDQRARIYRTAGWISPVLLVNGRMDGVWRHQKAGSRVSVEIEPFVQLPAWARRGAEQEAERLAAFLGGRLELRWGRSARATD